MRDTVLCAVVVAALVAAVGCVPAPETPAGDTDVGFVAVGDAGVGDAVSADVSRAMGEWARTHRVDALVTTGDNVYPDGDPALFPTRLDGPYRGWLGDRPMWAALGNHDVAGGWGDDQMRHLGLPGGWYQRELERGGVRLRVLVLDSNGSWAQQAAWLDERLGEPGWRWTVVVFHHPVWSCGRHGNSAASSQWFAPIIESHHVDLVLSGHDHLYQRFEDAGVQWLVTGGGGAPLYGAQPCAAGTPAPAVTAVRHHFVAVRADAQRLDVTVRTRDGVTLDRFELT